MDANWDGVKELIRDPAPDDCHEVSVRNRYWQENIHTHLLSAGYMTDSWLEFLLTNERYVKKLITRKDLLLEIVEVLISSNEAIASMM